MKMICGYISVYHAQLSGIPFWYIFGKLVIERLFFLGTIKSLLWFLKDFFGLLVVQLYTFPFLISTLWRSPQVNWNLRSVPCDHGCQQPQCVWLKQRLSLTNVFSLEVIASPLFFFLSQLPLCFFFWSQHSSIPEKQTRPLTLTQTHTHNREPRVYEHSYTHKCKNTCTLWHPKTHKHTKSIQLSSCSVPVFALRDVKWGHWYINLHLFCPQPSS